MPIKNMTLINFSDLLDFATCLGYTYNNAHDLLVNAKLHIGYLSSDHYGDTAYNLPHEHTEARSILKQFMQKHQISELYITHKYYEIS